MVHVELVTCLQINERGGGEGLLQGGSRRKVAPAIATRTGRTCCETSGMGGDEGPKGVASQVGVPIPFDEAFHQLWACFGNFVFYPFQIAKSDKFCDCQPSLARTFLIAPIGPRTWPHVLGGLGVLAHHCRRVGRDGRPGCPMAAAQARSV